jgi:ribosomal-protein-serine acetyltransferase
MTAPNSLGAFPSLSIDERVVLRAVEREDAEALCTFVLANRDHLASFLVDLVDEISNESAARAHLDRVIEMRALGSLLEMHIFEADVLCGAVRLRNIDWNNRSGNIGYLIGASFQGRGIITRTVDQFLKWAFAELQLHRIELRCAAANLASVAVAGRLGFTLEGTLRDAERLNDRYCDILVFSRLHTDIAGGAP